MPPLAETAPSQPRSICLDRGEGRDIDRGVLDEVIEFTRTSLTETGLHYDSRLHEGRSRHQPNRVGRDSFLERSSIGFSEENCSEG